METWEPRVSTGFDEYFVNEIPSVLVANPMSLAVAMFGYFVYHWIVPFDLVKELEVDQNTSLGIVLGSIILGLCIIVAAAIASPS